MKKISLTTKEELNIYMSPTRQQLLRELNISNVPMTPKMLADRLHISASGVQHHIKKLMLLGIIELDHIEIINGIKASFYKPVKVTVQIGLSTKDDLSRQKEVFVQDSIAQVYDGFQKKMKQRLNPMSEQGLEGLQKWGDILTGVVHLNEQESEKLIRLITEFIEQHSVPADNSIPWEYAIIAYNAGDASNE